VVFHLFHILIKIYLACKVKVGLKKIFTSQFQTYLLSTFIILKFFKFYIQLTINPMENIYVFKMKDKKLSNLLSYVFVENYHIFKRDFKWTYFLV
jgi:hypothetical protein